MSCKVTSCFSLSGPPCTLADGTPPSQLRRLSTYFLPQQARHPQQNTEPIPTATASVQPVPSSTPASVSTEEQHSSGHLGGAILSQHGCSRSKCGLMIADVSRRVHVVLLRGVYMCQRAPLLAPNSGNVCVLVGCSCAVGGKVEGAGKTPFFVYNVNWFDCYFAVFLSSVHTYIIKKTYIARLLLFVINILVLLR